MNKYQENIILDNNRKRLLAKIKSKMSEKRFQHSLGVEKTAIELAEKNGVDPKKAGLAGLIHDYAKERSDDEFKEIIQKKKLDPDLINWNNAIWHGIVGAELIKDELKINDTEILDAIRKHTLGDAKMTKLEQVLYVADEIEPSRSFFGVDEIREIAAKDLAMAVGAEARHTLAYLVKNNQKIHPKIIETYNQWSVENRKEKVDEK